MRRRVQEVIKQAGGVNTEEMSLLAAFQNEGFGAADDEDDEETKAKRSRKKRTAEQLAREQEQREVCVVS